MVKLKIKHADATHISCGYRLKSPCLNTDQGYNDDGEIGQGRTILNALKERSMIEIAVFVVRYYGGRQMGKRRFEIAKDLTFAAVRSFKEARQRKITMLKTLSRAESRTSLCSDVSYLSTDETEDRGLPQRQATDEIPV